MEQGAAHTIVKETGAVFVDSSGVAIAERQ